MLDVYKVEIFEGILPIIILSFIAYVIQAYDHFFYKNHSHFIRIKTYPTVFSYHLVAPWKIIKKIVREKSRIPIGLLGPLYLSFLFALIPIGMFSFFEPMYFINSVKFGSPIFQSANILLVLIFVYVSKFFMLIANKEIFIDCIDYMEIKNNIKQLSNFIISLGVVFAMSLDYETSSMITINELQLKEGFSGIPIVGMFKQPVLFIILLYNFILLYSEKNNENGNISFRFDKQELYSIYGLSYFINRINYLSMLFVAVILFLGGYNSVAPFVYLLDYIPESIILTQVLSIVTKVFLLHITISVLKVSILNRRAFLDNGISMLLFHICILFNICYICFSKYNEL